MQDEEAFDITFPSYRERLATDQCPVVTLEFARLVRRTLGWEDVTFHCLRHTFGTQLAASGKISPFEVQKLMRHGSITTSMIYVNLAKQELPDIAVF